MIGNTHALRILDDGLDGELLLGLLLGLHEKLVKVTAGEDGRRELLGILRSEALASDGSRLAPGASGDGVARVLVGDSLALRGLNNRIGNDLLLSLLGIEVVASEDGRRKPLGVLAGEALASDSSRLAPGASRDGVARVLVGKSLALGSSHQREEVRNLGLDLSLDSRLLLGLGLLIEVTAGKDRGRELLGILGSKALASDSGGLAPGASLDNVAVVLIHDSIALAGGEGIERLVQSLSGLLLLLLLRSRELVAKEDSGRESASVDSSEAAALNSGRLAPGAGRVGIA